MITSSEYKIEIMQGLYSVLSDYSLSIEEQFDLLLKKGCELFGESIGIISHIEDNLYTVKHCFTPDGGLESGQTFAFDCTFCHITFEANRALGIEDVKNSPWDKHPCNDFGLASYIGAALTVSGKRYGTINFSRVEPREEKFLDLDLEFVEQLALWVSQLLSVQEKFSKLGESKTTETLLKLRRKNACSSFIKNTNSHN